MTTTYKARAGSVADRTIEHLKAHGVDMSNLREGDLAFVRGEIIKQDRASKYVGGPLYRASSVELNERVD